MRTAPKLLTRAARKRGTDMPTRLARGANENCRGARTGAPV